MAILNDLLVNGISRIIGPIYGASFIRHGGTSTQLLKADGSTLDFGTDTTKFLRNDGQWIVPASGGGGSTVTVNNASVTLSTAISTYITVDGTSCSMQLPASVPSTWLGTASTSCASGNHIHGNITNGGTIASSGAVSIASGDRLVITDSSASSSVNSTSIIFDASTTNQFLSKKGTWETVLTKETIYATCSTASNTATKEITISDYEPKDGDLLSIYFSNNVEARANIKINGGNTTYQISYMSFPITSNIIFGGDRALFCMDRSHSRCYLISTDRASALVLNAVTIHSGTTTPTSNIGNNGDIYIQTAS